MNKINIIKRQISDNNYIVFPESYINPLSNLSCFEEELLNYLNGPCNILVDLLLCNGENYNRFISLNFDGKKIKKESIKIVELTLGEQKIVNEFYIEHRKVIKNGVLIPSEYMKYVK